MNPIIDSNFEPHQVIIANPDKPAPDDILEQLGLMQVQYYSFDGKLHQGQIIVNQHVMSDVEAFFRQACEMRFLIERVVPVSAPQYEWDGPKVLQDNLTNGFDYRPVQTTDKLSKHSQGLAFDVNPQQNPYKRYEDGIKILHAPKGAEHNTVEPGTLTNDHPLVKLMIGFGWEWGGHWTVDSGRIDYMHFEKSS